MAISPDDVDKPFAARWNALVSALLIEPSIKLVARQACDYGFMDGEDIFPGNERLARQTGLTERTVREAWHFLRAAGMAQRIEHSAWTGARRTADRYELVIPDNWRRFPMLGPHAGKFTCQECGKHFNPSPCNTWTTHKIGKSEVPVTDGDGVRTVAWCLWKAVFCPEPRSGNGCLHYWKRANGHWGGNDSAWQMYHAARNDDWPVAFPKAALTEMSSGTGSEFRQHPEVTSGTPGTEFRQVPDLSSAQVCISSPNVKDESQRRRAFQRDRRLGGSRHALSRTRGRPLGQPPHHHDSPPGPVPRRQP